MPLQSLRLSQSLRPLQSLRPTKAAKHQQGARPLLMLCCLGRAPGAPGIKVMAFLVFALILGVFGIGLLSCFLR